MRSRRLQSFFNGWRSTPGTMRQRAMLDKLNSITAISVLSCFRTITGLVQVVRLCIGAPSVSPPPHSISKYRKLKWLGEFEAKDYAQLLHRGSAEACTQGKATKHGKPQGVVSDDNGGP